jgi:hypothetical protein
MNTKILKLCGWSGIACIVLMAIGFAVIAGFIPPPAPSDSAEQTARLFIDNRNAIRIGMILSMAASALLMPFAVAITLQMRRIEGPHSALAFIQLGMGAIFVLEFIYLIFFWQAATFRVDRTPELIQLLNDMAWIPFVGLSSTLVVQAAVFGWAILLDKRATPIFPRWLGYFNLWAALMFVPGTFNVFFLHGPLAWDGWLAFYFPVAVFVIWMVVLSIYLVKAVDHQVREELLADNPVALSAEVQRLRAEIDCLATRIATEKNAGPIQ